jgi:RHS repeat-associated protein
MNQTTSPIAASMYAVKRLRQISQTLALCASLACLLLQSGQALADTKVRTSSFEYDAQGLLIKEIIEPSSTPDCLQTSYAYDAKGNKTSVSTSACAGASGTVTWSASSPRTASSTYAAQTSTIAGVTYTVPAGIFPNKTSNALGQSESKAYDPRFGVVTSLIGPNSLTTTWVYDSFGRKTRESRADGTYTTWAYKLCTDTAAPLPSCPGPIGGAASVWVAIEQSYAVNNAINAPEKRQYYDSLDRVVRSQTQSFNGGFAGGNAYIIAQDTEYNTLGQVARSSNAYSPQSSASAVWTSYLYDILGRVTQQNTPDPDASGGVNITQFSYNGLSTTVTNAKGQTKTTVKNAQGQVAQVIDHLGSTIAYTYDALGQLLQTNAAGSITKMEYNQRGQKVKMQDPAMGEWLYAYNVFGELVSQRDSLGQTVTMDYDRLGRMTQRNETDLVSQWSYDKNFDNTACPKGIGKLCGARTLKSDGSTDYSRAHKYDDKGRIRSTATVLDNPASPAVISVTYDANTGRLASKTYPSGYKAGYQYTATGYLSMVTGYGGGSGKTATYQITGMNEHGQTTQTILGNGIWEQMGYNPTTKRLSSVRAFVPNFGPGGQPPDLMNQSYTYDNLSNLKTRLDNVTHVNEGFAYDGLNRLTNYTAVGGTLTSASPNNSVQVMYDARGNIQYKSDVGQYWYDTARPNRMTAVTLSTPVGGQPLTGSRALAYAFDDYRPGAKTVNGTVLGNGNLMYTVSQDTAQNRHTVRWEEYTSFNMPKQIKYANLVNTAAGVSTGPSVAATPPYSCLAGYALQGANCVATTTTPAQPICRDGNQVGDLVGVDLCYDSYLTNYFNPIYICPTGQTLSGSGAASVCAVNYPAVTTYTCPAGYQLSTTQCKLFTNNAATGANSTSSDRTLTFVYGPEHQRTKQVVQLNASAPATLKAGEGTTWYLNGEDSLGLAYEKEVKAGGITEHKHYLSAGGMVFALQVTRTGNLAVGSNASVPGSTQTSSLSYFHHDHLGSIAAITDETGKVVERLAYDPWGKRRYADGAADTTDSLTGKRTDRGYTEHEHLDEMGIIHMNGRVYDPLIGRMMSADSSIPDPYGLQSFNRYGYVYNNPLKLFDPTGFEPWGTSTNSDGSSGGNTQYSDTGNGTVANTWSGDTYAVDSGPNNYQPSRSTYGNGISAQNVAGPPGQGAKSVGEYSSSTGSWNLTDYGQRLGSSNGTYAIIVSDAVGDRSYRQIGQRDFKSPVGNILTAALQYLLARFGFGPRASVAVKGEAAALAEARAARDALSAELAALKKPPATVTGGYNVQTGEVAAKACGGGKCAENNVVDALGGVNKDIRFTEAVRPRTGEEVPICQRCQGTFSTTQFPNGTRFRND